MTRCDLSERERSSKTADGDFYKRSVSQRQCYPNRNTLSMSISIADIGAYGFKHIGLEASLLG